MEISKSIAKQRKKLRLSQKQLAEKIYISNVDVARWESGKTLPDATTLPLLAKALDVSVDTLVGDTSKENIMTGGKIKINRREISKFKAFIILGFAFILTAFLLTYIRQDTFVSSCILIFAVCSLASMIIGTLLYKSFYKEQFYTKIYKRVLVKYVILYLFIYIGLLCAISLRIFYDLSPFYALLLCLLIVGIILPIAFEKNGYNLSHKDKLTFYISTGILWLFFVVFAGLYFTAVQQQSNPGIILVFLILVFALIINTNYVFYGIMSKIKD